MKRNLISAAIIVAGICAIAACTSMGGGASSGAVATAISDPGRRAADTARGAARRPAEMIALAEMKSGDVVLELLPGGGYFTRIFSKVIGPRGHLYAAVPDAKSGDAEPAAAAI